MKSVISDIEGLFDPDLVAPLEQEISQLNGVHKANIDYGNSVLYLQLNSRNSFGRVSQVFQRAGLRLRNPDRQRNTYIHVKVLRNPALQNKITDILHNMNGVECFKFLLRKNLLRIAHKPEVLPEEILLHLNRKGVYCNAYIPKNPRSAISFADKLTLAICLSLFAASALDLFFPTQVLAFHILLTVTILLSSFELTRYGLYLAFTSRRLNSASMLLFAEVFALSQNWWHEAAFIGMSYSVCQLLMRRSFERIRLSVNTLAMQLPRVARMPGPGHQRKCVPIDQIKAGDVLSLEQNEILPCDGLLESDQAIFDEKYVKGTTKSIILKRGDNVYAGYRLKTKDALIRSTAPQCKSIFQKYFHELMLAIRTPTPRNSTLITWANRLKTSIGALAVIYIGANLIQQSAVPQDSYILLGILVLAIFDLFVISSKLNYINAILFCAHNGNIVRDNKVWRQLENVKNLIIDKPSVLTGNKPEVVDIVSLSQLSTKEVLQKAASVARNGKQSFHRCLVNKASAQEVDLLPTHSAELLDENIIKATIGDDPLCIANLQYLQLHNLMNNEIERRINVWETEGNSALFLTTPKTVLGIITLTDPIYSHVYSLADNLHAVHVPNLTLVSQDNPRASQVISERFGFDQFKANFNQQDKLEFIKAQKRATENSGVISNNNSILEELDLLKISTDALNNFRPAYQASAFIMDSNPNQIAHVINYTQRFRKRIRLQTGFFMTHKGLLLTLLAMGYMNFYIILLLEMLFYYYSFSKAVTQDTYSYFIKFPKITRRQNGFIQPSLKSSILR